MDQKETHAALAGFAAAVGSDRNMWMLLCCPNASHRKENNLLDANFSTSAKQPSCFAAEVALARCLMGETFCGDSTEPVVLVHIKTPFPPGTFFAFLHCSFPSLPAHLFPCRPLTHEPREAQAQQRTTRGERMAVPGAPASSLLLDAMGRLVGGES